MAAGPQQLAVGAAAEKAAVVRREKKKKKQAVSSRASLAASLVLQLSPIVKAIGCEQQLGQGLHSGAEVPQSQSQPRGKDGAPPFSFEPCPWAAAPSETETFHCVCQKFLLLQFVSLASCPLLGTSEVGLAVSSL